ncbi:MAG: tRNA (adenosine(37)-N6)-threonylcarbamoyltransferase complex ATPase subunit type 1 TsaE [Chitinophagaceae bacterium]|nr:MAG: tRNA (adenosine(37)-N6)-threonylcarbamoyltransferase complex ATPase subunit type 1 TsaE [Chitinophagaceae bacterium]
MEIRFTLAEIENAARQFLTVLQGKQVIAFHGEMGAGKTTFIKTLCEIAGVQSAVSSPTFSIINQYQAVAGIIYHLDLYRLNSVEEAIDAGVEDVLYSGNTCYVEWPEKAPGLLPPETVHVFINLVDPDTRNLSATT